MNILFVSSEVEPFSKTGGLADVSGALPRALHSLGHDVRIVTPQYRDIDVKFGISSANVIPTNGLSIDFLTTGRKNYTDVARTASSLSSPEGAEGGRLSPFSFCPQR